jgi:hypothetical protein
LTWPRGIALQRGRAGHGLVASRVPGVGRMPLERYGFALLPGWNGVTGPTSPTYAMQLAPKGTLWETDMIGKKASALGLHRKHRRRLWRHKSRFQLVGHVWGHVCVGHVACMARRAWGGDVWRRRGPGSHACAPARRRQRVPAAPLSARRSTRAPGARWRRPPLRRRSNCPPRRRWRSPCRKPPTPL